MRLRLAIPLFLLKLVAGLEEITEPSYCCSALASSGLKDRLLLPGQEEYDDRANLHFSAIARLKPECILRPHTAAEVSLAVKALVEANATQPCKFAIRSGGHMNWDGAASIVNGVTIDLGWMNSTTYNPNNNTASILPGATWGMVYATLDKLGVMVAGGRAASVGVGGLVLGGGNSYFGARMGLVCDNVEQFEVVLASGEIATANRDHNPDLFQVLKGGNNNFGILTRVELATFPNGNLWGGIVTYPYIVAPQALSALVNFSSRLKDDPFGSILYFASYISTLQQAVVTIMYEYTKPVERPPVFDDFLAIPGNISDTTRITNLTDLVEEIDEPLYYRNKFFTVTFQNNLEVLEKAHQFYSEMVQTLKREAAGDYLLHTLIQPIPTIYAERAKEKGSNVLGLDRAKNDLILYLLYTSWMGSEQDDLFQGQALGLIEKIHKFAASIGAENEFIYLPYSDKTQDPLGSYGKENIAKMRAAAKKYDPTGVFQNMVPGGFKISKVVEDTNTVPEWGRDEL